MALLTKAPRGTADMLPDEIYKVQHLEQIFTAVAESFGYREIRTPVFEHTELFQRSVGETTDVVQKEMYTFTDNGGRSITLRPEGTAGAARALLEHGLNGGLMPQKLYYKISCYRYEKPQAGRLREFHQFGVECFGAESPLADAEVIALAQQVFYELGVEGLTLEINSIGCPECRKAYHKALKEYFTAHLDALCDTCKGRLEKNPMRILDCKSPVCSEIAKDAPVILDYLCDDCRRHFDGVQKELRVLNVDFTVNPRIVRGLDYYTRTVFEFVSNAIGAQGTVCGGGRYDGLIEEMGGKSLPALGFGMGVERLKLLMENTDCPFPEPARCDIFLLAADKKAVETVSTMTAALRDQLIFAERDLCGRSLKAQMKYADKLGAAYTVVIGENELASGNAMLKNMRTGETQTLSLVRFIDDFDQIIDHDFEAMMKNFTDDTDLPSADGFLRVIDGGKKRPPLS